MRRVIQWTLLPAAVIAVACSKSHSKSPTAMSEELKRDLKLASQTQDLKINPDEVAPQSHQEMALKTKSAPQGPKVIRTNHPTVKASATPAQVAEIKSDIPQVQVMASAPAPSETPSADSPPLARPSAVPTQSYPGSQHIPGNGGSAGGVLAGIFGAILRGGAVDDDHCDPRGAPMPRTGRPIGGDAHPSGTGAVFGGGIGSMRGGGGIPTRGRPR